MWPEPLTADTTPRDDYSAVTRVYAGDGRAVATVVDGTNPADAAVIAVWT